MLANGWQTIPEGGAIWSGESFKFWWASNHISGTAEARIVKFCTQVDCIKF